MVGKWNTEFPLEHLSWQDPKEDNKRWEQFTVSPCFAVSDQFALLEQTGL
jgi:hypothetical protein